MHKQQSRPPKGWLCRLCGPGRRHHEAPRSYHLKDMEIKQRRDNQAYPFECGFFHTALRRLYIENIIPITAETAMHRTGCFLNFRMAMNAAINRTHFAGAMTSVREIPFTFRVDGTGYWRFHESKFDTKTWLGYN